MAAYERHAYEMAPVRSISMRRVYEGHVYGIVYWRCTPIKYPSIGDIYLEDTFNQSIQIAFTIWDSPNGLAPRNGYVWYFCYCGAGKSLPRVANHEGVLGLGGVAKGVLP